MSAEDLYERVTDAGLSVDIPVNNAGFGSYGPLLTDDSETDRALIELHVAPVARLPKLCGREKAERGRDNILKNPSTTG